MGRCCKGMPGPSVRPDAPMDSEAGQSIVADGAQGACGPTAQRTENARPALGESFAKCRIPTPTLAVSRGLEPGADRCRLGSENARIPEETRAFQGEKTERAGFEPAVHLSAYTGLANRRSKNVTNKMKSTYSTGTIALVQAFAQTMQKSTPTWPPWCRLGRACRKP